MGNLINHLNRQALEARLRRIKGLDDAAVFEIHKTLVALFVLADAGALSALTRRQIQDQVDRINRQLAAGKKIASFTFLERALLAELGEITKDGKLRRDVISKKHPEILIDLFDCAENKKGNSDETLR